MPNLVLPISLLLLAFAILFGVSLDITVILLLIRTIIIIGIIVASMLTGIVKVAMQIYLLSILLTFSWYWVGFYKNGRWQLWFFGIGL